MTVARKPLKVLLALATLLTFSNAAAVQVLPGSDATAADEAALLTLATLQGAAVARYQRLELTLSAEPAPTDPYDPAQAPTVHFRSPAGASFDVPAFWYQDFGRQTLSPQGDPHWRLRFTPSEAGEWTAQAALPGQGRGEPVAFEVTSSTSSGFLRVHPENPRYLAFEGGAPFFAIGINLGWSTGDVLADYERWFDALFEQGANTARLWMASWSFGLEWRDTGLGDYTNRLDRAWLLDRVFEMAEARGIYLILVLINHGAFSTTTNPEWRDNPYNAALGGPCEEPQCFATDEKAKAFFKRRLHYLAARWSHTPNLLAWEWWNEINWTPISTPLFMPWLTEMTAYLRQHDPYNHLSTHSYAGSGEPSVWLMPELDLMQKHEYTMRDPLQFFPRGYTELARVAQKPLLFGEFGNSTGTEDTSSLDQDGIHLHNGLWAAALSGYASTAMYWWWDSYVEPLDLWYRFGGLATFLEGEDLASLTPTPVEATGDLRALALQSLKHALVWLRSRHYAAEDARDDYIDALRSGQSPSEWRFDPPVIEGQSVTLSGLTEGVYLVAWYSPQEAGWLHEETVAVVDGVLNLAVPSLKYDLAFKLKTLNLPGP